MSGLWSSSGSSPLFDTNGALLANAAITVYVAGSSPLQLASLYSDAALTQPVANPFTTDGGAGFAVWLAPGTYVPYVGGNALDEFTVCDPTTAAGLATETSRAESAEATNASNLSAETTRAKAAETAAVSGDLAGNLPGPLTLQATTGVKAIASAAAPVQSVAGKTGAVTLGPTDVGADPAGAAAAVTVASIGAAGPLSAAGLVPPAQLRATTHLAASATLTPEAQLVTLDTTGGAVTVTLPDATKCGGAELLITKTSTDTNVATTSGTISGGGNAILTAQGDTYRLISDGTTWQVVALKLAPWVFSASGTWTRPAGVTNVDVDLIDGGAGGGGAGSALTSGGVSNQVGAPGGAAGMWTHVSSYAPAATEAVVVGAGSAGGAGAAANGAAGSGAANAGTSKFGPLQGGSSAGGGGSGANTANGLGNPASGTPFGVPYYSMGCGGAPRNSGIMPTPDGRYGGGWGGSASATLGGGGGYAGGPFFAQAMNPGDGVSATADGENGADATVPGGGGGGGGGGAPGGKGGNGGGGAPGQVTITVVAQ